MATENQYKVTKLELCTYIQDILESQTEEVCKANLVTFKKFIDSNEIIEPILSDILKNNIPIKIEEFLKCNGGGYFFELRIPEDKKTHIATMYDTLRWLCEEDISILHLSIRITPGAKSSSYKDKIQYFIKSVFMPLFRYIDSEIEKGRISVEEKTNGSTIVNQTVSGTGNTVVFSGRDSVINIGKLKEEKEDLKALIQEAMKELDKSDIDELEKEEISDDLQTLLSEVESEEPRAVKFRKVKRNIDSFISGANETLKESSGLISTLMLLGAQLSILI